jgi:hypothetical protein
MKLESIFFLYEDVSKSFRPESVTKYTLIFGSSRYCPLQRVMAAKLTRLIHKIPIQVYLVAESCTICSCRSRRPVRKLLDTSSCLIQYSNSMEQSFLRSELSLSQGISLLWNRKVHYRVYKNLDWFIS